MGKVNPDKAKEVLRRRLREAFGENNYRMPFMPGVIQARQPGGPWQHFAWQDDKDVLARLDVIIAARRSSP